MANAMTSEPAYQALFLGAGPPMTCGAGYRKLGFGGYGYREAANPRFAGVVPGAGAAYGGRRREIPPPLARDARKARARQLHFVNPDAHRRHAWRPLARGRLRAKR